MGETLRLDQYDKNLRHQCRFWKPENQVIFSTVFREAARPWLNRPEFGPVRRLTELWRVQLRAMANRARYSGRGRANAGENFPSSWGPAAVFSAPIRGLLKYWHGWWIPGSDEHQTVIRPFFAPLMTSRFWGQAYRFQFCRGSTLLLNLIYGRQN